MSAAAGALARRLSRIAVALAFLGTLSACFGLSTRPAGFRARPDSVTAGRLRGPFRGRVIEAETGKPVDGAVVYATWTLRAGYGMTLPAGHREYVTSTDARGMYEVPAIDEPGGGVRITDFHMVIYERGFVAYRSDRGFPDFGPRRDFAQVNNEVALVRWRGELSHAHHLRYVGGGTALAALVAWEAAEAAAELTAPGEIAIATPLRVHAFLAKHGLDGLIHAVYGVDSPGSKARKISMACDRLLENKKQESVFMIGDSLSDILAAKEASVTSIAVTWGHQSLESLLRGNPDYVVNSPDDLIEIVEQ